MSGCIYNFKQMSDYIYNLYFYNEASALKGLLNTTTKMYYSYICVQIYARVSMCV